MRDKLTEEEKQKLVTELNKRIHGLNCPMCHNPSFIILDGYFNQPIQAELNGVMLGGPSLPSIGIVCNNCGFISQHALGVLGFLPKKDENKDNDTNSK
ncbi:hypothetical protein B5F99_18995 [Odoribacter splanchnicus]|uniref:hypothetical protein n=1 Tax=Odoribacter splanchnicus TaxID=28118 RepID=UPI000B38E74C|nr:hypothetical protein [Odoribacter splanchnicus]OUN89256.1 hypothetical protein B5F99_18995 [Odoribacter splanchnicus]